MKPYFQTTSFTTAAASLLTILTYLNPDIKHSKLREFDIWRSSVNLPTRASSIYALATYAKKCGLDPKVVVESKEYKFPDYRFYRYTKDDILHASFASTMHQNKAERENIQIEERRFTIDEITEELKEGKVILLRLNTKPIWHSKRNTSNYIVLHGFQEELYNLIDPAFGALSIPRETLQEAFDSLETKKYRDHRMIVFGK
ncbi:peptidase C39 family protein [Candidatus Woesearchaeota archaeon]|nr:peptidase C39 family protein [Candidatus Woesearchaeota archaeon]